MRLFDSTVLIFIVACVAATYASGVLWLNSPIFNVQMLCVATGAWLILMLGRLRSINTHSQGIQRRILVALGVCVVLVAPLHDMFSDDTRRYLWDGVVVASGDNPYASAPLQQPLVAHRIVLPDGVMLPDDMPYASMRTIYPPGTQVVVGAIVAVLGTPTVHSFEIAWWLLLAVVLCAALYSADTRERPWIALAALSPVFLIHGLADVHSDALMAAVALLGVIALRRDRLYLGAVLIAIAITIKYVPVLLVPALFIGRSRREQITVVGIVVCIIAALYLPFITTFTNLLGSLPVFAEHWQANSLFYSMCTWFDVAWLTPERIRMVSALVAIALAVLIGVRHRAQPIVAAMMIYMAVLACSPVVHAWYIILPLLLFPFAPLRSTIVWATTMCVYGVFYLTYKGDGVWFEHPIALAIEFIPVWIAIGRDIQRGPLLLRDEQRTRDLSLT
jgi:hypothetical protein